LKPGSALLLLSGSYVRPTRHAEVVNIHARTLSNRLVSSIFHKKQISSIVTTPNEFILRTFNTEN